MSIKEYQEALATFEQAIRNLLQDYHIPDAIPQLYRGYIVEVFSKDPCIKNNGRCSDRESQAKHCYRAMLRYNLDLSTQEAADLSGGINHTSICNSLKAHRNLMDRNKEYNAKVMEVQSKIDNYERN